MTSVTTGPRFKAMKAHQYLFGRFVNPRRRDVALADWDAWIADNGAFTGFNQDVYMSCVKRLLPFKATCKFVTVPDVPFQWLPTLDKYRDWSPSLRRMGFPIGLAVQDGATVENIPWREIDGLFIGGSTEWKRQSGIGDLPLFKSVFGSPVGDIVQEAKSRGLWVHVGRSANAVKQFWYAHELGADSVDGTKETKAPDREFKWIAQTIWEINCS